MNRRKFLKKTIQGMGAGILAASPLAIFLNHIANGYRYRAFAQSINGSSGYDDSSRLINLCLNGGPSRWFYDCPLKPNGASDPFQYNLANDPRHSMLITRLNPVSNPNDGILGYCGEYATHQVNGVHLPYLWSGKIATPNGGSTQMELLAKNMLMMRGLVTTDGHFNAGLPVNPPGQTSLGGIVAEKSTQIFPAIGYRTDNRFYQSAQGIPMNKLDIGSPIVNLFTPFNIGSIVLDSNSNDIGSAMDSVLDAMKLHAGDHHRMYPNSYQQRLNAKLLMKKNYSQLSSAYTALKNKYTTLMNRSFSDPSLRLSGVDDLLIQGQSDINQMRTEIQGTYGYYTGSNISEMIDQYSYMKYLPDEFAVIEFLMTGGSVFDQSLNSYANLVVHATLYNCNDVDQENGTTLLNVDAHASGSYVQLVMFARYYRAISSMLYEFIEKLKSKTTTDGKNLFDHTAILLTSEFARDAHDDAKGADHGALGSNYTVISGKIPNTMVIGDILKSTGQIGKNNTWGMGAPLAALTNQKANYNNAISTVAHLLNVESPAPNSSSLVSVNPSTGALTSLIGSAQNVEVE